MPAIGGIALCIPRGKGPWEAYWKEDLEYDDEPEQESVAKVRVFISYSQHDPAMHSQRVLTLAHALADDGLDVELDQYHQNELIDWPGWCEERLRPVNSDFVLTICSAEYKRRIENRVAFDVGRGVFWEGRLIFDYLYRAKANERFIPILLGDETEIHSRKSLLA
jgi:SEFIR domain